MKTQQRVSSEFPYESQYVTVHDAQVHYVEAGTNNPPVLLLHGIPTHAYLWRNVIPHVSPHARTLAIDLIGYGKSDKPIDIEYTVHTYTRYLEGVIETLNLRDIVLVVMDLGAIVGLNYAMQHEANVKGIVMFEGFFLPVEAALKNQSFPARLFMRLFRIKKFAEHVIVRSGTAVEKMIAMGTVRTLSEEEMETYRDPLRSEEVKRRVWLEGVGPYTLAKGSNDVVGPINQYTAKLCRSPIPKLLLYAEPGAAVTEKSIRYAQEHLPNLEIKCIGPGKHFLPEDQPDTIGQAIVEFYRRKVLSEPDPS